MSAALSANLGPGVSSNEVTVVPNQIFSVQTTLPVNVEALLRQTTPDQWVYVGRVGGSVRASGASPFIATSDRIRVTNPASVGTASVEVYT